jgi:hypothetical protein
LTFKAKGRKKGKKNRRRAREREEQKGGGESVSIAHLLAVFQFLQMFNHEFWRDERKTRQVSGGH